jgi:hypothetical protein
MTLAYVGECKIYVKKKDWLGLWLKRYESR